MQKPKSSSDFQSSQHIAELLHRLKETDEKAETAQAFNSAWNELLSTMHPAHVERIVQDLDRIHDDPYGSKHDISPLALRAMSLVFQSVFQTRGVHIGIFYFKGLCPSNAEPLVITPAEAERLLEASFPQAQTPRRYDR